MEIPVDLNQEKSKLTLSSTEFDYNHKVKLYLEVTPEADFDLDDIIMEVNIILIIKADDRQQKHHVIIIIFIINTAQEFLGG